MAAAPPMAEANEPTTVTPIWTVARKRCGFFWTCSTRRAFGFPAAARLAMWVLRAERTANSAAEKKPFARIRMKIRKNSFKMRSNMIILPGIHAQ